MQSKEEGFGKEEEIKGESSRMVTEWSKEASEIEAIAIHRC